MPAAPSLRTTIAIVTLLAAVPRLAASLYTPSMPSLSAEFGASMAEVKITFTAYIAGLAVGQILYGPISDSVGRKPVLLIGLTLFSLLSLACM
ncbi:MAG: MFS transporter, partial [Sphingomonadales bacterium]|nr:MFS transporter [Sphingomonadales bacterium]